MSGHEGGKVGDDGREGGESSVGSEDLEEVGDDRGRTLSERADELGSFGLSEGRVGCVCMRGDRGRGEDHENITSVKPLTQSQSSMAVQPILPWARQHTPRYSLN